MTEVISTPDIYGDRFCNHRWDHKDLEGVKYADDGTMWCPSCFDSAWPSDANTIDVVAYPTQEPLPGV